MKIVNGSGPIGAKLMIVGEAPGEEEERIGIPFVGPSGKILRRALFENGISPEECYITNVVKIRPPHNNLKLLAIPIDTFLPQLREEIEKINPNCILLVGNTALKYLTGLDKITRWRGSIVTVLGKWKGVPCIHPAEILNTGNWINETILRCFDVKRAVKESEFPQLNLPFRNIIVCDNSLQLVRFLENIKEKVSVDIETSLAIPICIGLSENPNEAISVNLWGKATRDKCQIWKDLLDFFNDTKIKIIGQNFKFDQYICNTAGIRIPDPYSDTMLKMHTCYPELPKSLQFLASVFTREPYYKDEGKEFDIKKHGISRLMRYNAKDAAITIEADNSLELELTDLKVKDFYYNYVMKLHKFYYDIDSIGFKVDKKVQEELKVKYFDKYRGLDLSNRRILGYSFNPNSPKQCEEVIFGHLKCPKRVNTKEDTLNQMVGNNVVKSNNAKEVISNLLEMRKIRKTLGTYIIVKADRDGRLRTNYKIVGTETGRSSTEKCGPPLRNVTTGWPFQQITKHSETGKDIRNMVVADDGYVFMEMDKSQAEGRIVALLSKDEDLLKAYDTIDVHSLTAAGLFGLVYDQIRKEYKEGNIKKRQLGKKTRHAGNYGMGKHRLMMSCAEEELYVSEKECALFLFKFHKDNYKIQSIFWKEVQDHVNQTRTLINPYGRLRQFFGQAGDELYKEAYANIPQSTVPDSLRIGLLKSFNRINCSIDYAMVQEGHDSGLFLVREGYEKALATELKKDQEIPIDFSRCSLSRGKLVIPVEFKIGKRWSEMEDFEV